MHLYGAISYGILAWEKFKENVVDECFSNSIMKSNLKDDNIKLSTKMICRLFTTDAFWSVFPIHQ